MNIIELEAVNFLRKYPNRSKVVSLDSCKETLTSQIYNFNRNRDKLDFLKTLRNLCIKELEKHKKICIGECEIDKKYGIAIFAIDQEIQSINEYYSFTPKPEQSFTVEEESNLHSKLNDIIDELKKQGIGQEIIFDEIEDLKNHFNLGKKTWFQLVKAKLVDLTVETALEKTIVAGIFATLSDGFQGITKLIP